MKPLAASLLEALDYDSSDDSDFKVGDASGKCFLLSSLFSASWNWAYFQSLLKIGFDLSANLKLKHINVIYFVHVISLRFFY